MDCEICGSVPAVSRARIDNVVFSVCNNCAASGTVVDEIKQTRVVNAVEPVGPEEIVVIDFHKHIQKARQVLGLKQDELATRLNEKLSVIQAAESGKRSPDIKLARKLESFLKIKLIEEV